ncbi:MAG: hypothetical protein HY561_07670 [Gemmatimonadetes bacterium]|nr:hypothetical protein [Gemmatimonadota bacterium]
MRGDATSGRTPASGSAPLPPVVTRPAASRGAASSSGGMLPPFLAGAPRPSAPAARPSSRPAPAPPARPVSTSAADAGRAAQKQRDPWAAPDAPQEFPLDAFIIPEGAERLPAGVAAPAASAVPRGEAPKGAPAAARELADRLEALAQRLRREGAAALGQGMASSDRFEVLLAGLLAGYLAARND